MPAYIGKYSAKEEVANTITHAFGTLMSILGLIILLNSAAPENDIARIVSFIIYGGSLISLFATSTLYHSATVEKTKLTYKLLDHCAIYLLIAGTYTPILMIALKGLVAPAILYSIWGLAILGIVFKIKYGSKYKKISLATYVGLGGLSIFLLESLAQVLPNEAINLLIAGGVIYVLGIVFYVQQKIPYNHAIWHVFVLTAAACHFFMILRYV